MQNKKKESKKNRNCTEKGIKDGILKRSSEGLSKREKKNNIKCHEEKCWIIKGWV